METNKVKNNSFMSKLNKMTKKVLSVILTVLFVLGEIMIGIYIFGNLMEIAKIQVAKMLPMASNPVARFLTKVNWETKTIEFDATPSKTYNNKIEKYIWRIDDGSSSAEGSKFSHTFKNPGFYEILFSIIDTNGQSDQADCRILFPPEEVEQIAVSEKIDNQSMIQKKEINYKWVPKGTFFNYSKLNLTGVGDLRSPYVETGCGFSDMAYNSYDIYQNVTQRNLILRNRLPRIAAGLTGLIVVAVAFAFLKRKIASTTASV